MFPVRKKDSVFSMVDKISKMRRVAMAMSEELGREPTDDELSEEIGIDRAKLSRDGQIDYDARSEAPKEKNLWTEKEYGDYTLIIDWRLKEAPYQNPRMAYLLPDGTEARDIKGKPLTLTLPDADSGILLCSVPEAKHPFSRSTLALT